MKSLPSQQLIPPDCMAQLDLWAPDTSAYVCTGCVCVCLVGVGWARVKGGGQKAGHWEPLNTNGHCLLPRINLEGEEGMPSGLPSTHLRSPSLSRAEVREQDIKGICRSILNTPLSNVPPARAPIWRTAGKRCPSSSLSLASEPHMAWDGALNFKFLAQ